MHILSPEQRREVPALLLYRLKYGGNTIRELGSGHPGDRAQVMHQDKAVWHRKSDIDGWIAKRLRLPPSLWGKDRLSDDLTKRTAREIIKLRKKKIIADWSSTKRTAIFRLADQSIKVKMPRMSTGRTTTHAKIDNIGTLFLSIISASRKDNTYKLALGKTLLDYCKNHTPDGKIHKIEYDDLAEAFLKHYWYQRYKFRMKQDFHTKKTPRVIKILEDVFGDNPSPRFEDSSEHDLNTACQKIRNNVFGLERQRKSIVVPKFQMTMSGNIAVENDLFYNYDDNEGKIYLKPDAHRFFHDNYGLLMRALLAEWVRYLERANRGLPMLAAKLYRADAKRGPLVKYKKLFLPYSDHCFYCNNSFGSEKIHVDHFIPWSYIFEDDAWNLVLACQDCNLGKHNSLPPDEFVKCLINRDDEYSKTMTVMEQSLRQLSTTKSWEDEIYNHYSVCKEYGFGLWDEVWERRLT